MVAGIKGAVLNIQWDQHLLEIALCVTVFEINNIFHIQMAAEIWTGLKLVLNTQGSKICLKLQFLS